VRRARAWAAEADLRLWVIDAAMFHVKQDEELAVVQAGDWAVINKIDLVDAYRLEELRETPGEPGPEGR
jgi:tRNA modification GTPase